MPALPISKSNDDIPPRTHLEVRVNLLTLIFLLLALLYCFLLLVRCLESRLTPRSPVNPWGLPVARVRRLHAVYAQPPTHQQPQQRQHQDPYDPLPHSPSAEAGPSTLPAAPPPYEAGGGDFERQRMFGPAQDVQSYGATRGTDHKCSCPHSL